MIIAELIILSEFGPKTEKTTIITPFGLNEFPRMTFGLRNTAQTFQLFINSTALSGIERLNYNTANESNKDSDITGQSVVSGYLMT